MDLQNILDILYEKVDRNQIYDLDYILNYIQKLSDCLDYIRIDLTEAQDNPYIISECITLCNTFNDGISYAGRELKRVRQIYTELRDAKKFDREVEYNNHLLSDDIRDSGKSIIERKAMALQLVVKYDKDILEYNKIASNLKIVEDEIECVRKRLKQSSYDIKEINNIMKDTWSLVSSSDPKSIKKEKTFKKKPEGLLNKVEPQNITESTLGEEFFKFVQKEVKVE